MLRKWIQTLTSLENHQLGKWMWNHLNCCTHKHTDKQTTHYTKNSRHTQHSTVFASLSNFAILGAQNYSQAIDEILWSVLKYTRREGLGAVNTSAEKSTWPGESIRLMRNSRPSESLGILSSEISSCNDHENEFLHGSQCARTLKFSMLRYRSHARWPVILEKKCLSLHKKKTCEKGAESGICSEWFNT